MGLFKAPSVPTPTPTTPTPSPSTQAASQVVQGAQAGSRLNAAASAGTGSTVLTSALGLQQTNTNQPKTLLGG